MATFLRRWMRQDISEREAELLHQHADGSHRQTADASCPACQGTRPGS